MNAEKTYERPWFHKLSLLTPFWQQNKAAKIQPRY